MLILAMMAPAFTHGEIFTDTWKHVDESEWKKYLPGDIMLLGFSGGVILTVFFSAFVLSHCAPAKLNYCLRFLIILFNTVYPTNSIASIFWLALPPWLCFSAAFPFSLNAVAATIGSLLLKYVEFSIVRKMKKDSEQHGSELSEMSIFRSQQMDKVTVPIKMRAVVKGLSTGWLDVQHKHDNSWWESFGAAQAAQWVQIWLMLVSGAMAASLIVGPVHLVIGAFSEDGVSHIIIPIGFGMTVALINLWVLFDPLIYILSGNKPRITLRYLEVVVLIVMTLITISLVSGPGDASGIIAG